MYDGQIAVRLSRQLKLESKLLDELEQHCILLGRLVGEFVNDTSQPLDLLDAESTIVKFLDLVEETNLSRIKLNEFLSNSNVENEGKSFRQIIELLPDPFRTNLNSQRRKLYQRTKSLKSEVAADFSIVYHSFDFYRRMIDGLVDRVAEEQCYDPSGKAPNSDYGQFVRKAC